jgi:hypothetical protein
MSPSATPAPQDPRRGEHRREVSDGDEHMTEINMIPIGWHKVAKILIDSGASLNLIMRKNFIEMGPNLSDLTPVHDTFHEVILGLASTPIGRIDLEVSRRTGENKYREMLTFEVVSFGIGYNCILGRSFLLKFMAVIHTTYATIKMFVPRGVITLKSDQFNALAYENASLTHTGRFGKEEAQKLAAKVAKTHRGGTPAKAVTPGPSVGSTSKTHVAKQKQGMMVTHASTQRATDQLVADEKKGVTDKEIQVDPTDVDKKLRISAELEAK